MLEVQTDRAWRNIVTLDESRFDLNTNHEFICLPGDEKVDAHNRVESTWVSIDECSPKWVQIQHRLRYRRDTLTDIQMACN
jgi:hypothetical protein